MHLKTENKILKKKLENANSSILNLKNYNETIKLKLNQEMKLQSDLEKKNVSIFKINFIYLP